MKALQKLKYPILSLILSYLMVLTPIIYLCMNNYSMLHYYTITILLYFLNLGLNKRDGKVKTLTNMALDRIKCT